MRIYHVFFIIGGLLMLFTAFSLFGDNITGDVVRNPIVCDRPYIHFEDGCCLDENSNRICDVDEEDDEEGYSRGRRSSCAIAPGFSCEDFVVRSYDDAMVLAIRNGMGEDIEGISVLITESDSPWEVYCELKCEEGCYPNDKTISDGELAYWISRDCKNIGYSGSKFEADVVFSYLGDFGLRHTKTGYLDVFVE